jgi:hypothetical protein
MSEKTKTITLDVDGVPVTVTVARATAVAGIGRYRLMFDEINTDSEDMRYFRGFVYPNLIAGTQDVQGMEWPQTVEQMSVLDEITITPWIEAVYDVNPNWEPKAAPTETVQKKD